MLKKLKLRLKDSRTQELKEPHVLLALHDLEGTQKIDLALDRTLHDLEGTLRSDLALDLAVDDLESTLSSDLALAQSLDHARSDLALARAS